MYLICTEVAPCFFFFKRALTLGQFTLQCTKRPQSLPTLHSKNRLNFLFYELNNIHKAPSSIKLHELEIKVFMGVLLGFSSKSFLAMEEANNRFLY